MLRDVVDGNVCLIDVFGAVCTDAMINRGIVGVKRETIDQNEWILISAQHQAGEAVRGELYYSRPFPSAKCSGV